MKCKKCGADIKEEDRFCNSCGAKVESDNITKETSESNSKKIDKIKQYILTRWNGFDLFTKVITIILCLSVFLFLIATMCGRGMISCIFQIGLASIAELIHKNVITIKKSYVKYILLGCSVIVILLTFKLIFTNSRNKLDNNISEKVVEVKTPMSAEECVGKNRQEIYDAFNKAGFKNIIYCNEFDLETTEDAKVDEISEISINEDNNFKANKECKSNDQVIIKYHDYKKYKVKVHINFEGNLLFSKYDVSMLIDGFDNEDLKHGDDADFEYDIQPGDCDIEFKKKDDDDVTGSIKITINGDTEVSLRIHCYNDEISVIDEGKQKEEEESRKAEEKKEEESRKQEEYEEESRQAAEDEEESKKLAKEEAEKNKVLTIKNCEDLKNILTMQSADDSEYADFAEKYEGRIIQFSGSVDNIMNHGNYKTRYDILMSAGEYSEEHQTGPSFKFEDVNMFDIDDSITGYDGDSIYTGLNITIKAVVDHFDEDKAIFYLEEY